MTLVRTQAEADEHLAHLAQPQPEEVHQREVGRHRKYEGVHLQALNIICKSKLGIFFKRDFSNIVSYFSNFRPGCGSALFFGKSLHPDLAFLN